MSVKAEQSNRIHTDVGEEDREGRGGRKCVGEPE